MSELSSDPARLFTPEPANPPPPSSSPDFAPPKLVSSPQTRNFYIDPPSLPSDTKKQYKSLPESSLTSEVEIPVDEVVGEYKEGNNLYYFARCGSGSAHKFPEIPFLQRYGGLVEEFSEPHFLVQVPQFKAYPERKRAAGTLQHFDPSAHYVHPNSRVKMTLNINKKRAIVNISSSRSLKAPQKSEVVPDSEDEEDELLGPVTNSDGIRASKNDSLKDETEEDNEDDDEYTQGGTPQRKTRHAKLQLPFSPRKARSKPIIVHDSESEVDDDQSEGYRPTRRSTRSTRNTKTVLGVDSTGTESSDDDTGYESSRRSSRKSKAPLRKKVVKLKTCQPAYGHFRSVSEIDYDTYPNDAKNVSLRQHNSLCEKCQLEPAHKLLAAPKSKKRKRKKSTEDEFEESEGEEKFNALGGWIRCLKCSVSVHWRCLASTQRDEILKAAREFDRKKWEEAHAGESDDDAGHPPTKRVQLDVDQITDFICGSCMKGGVCIGCKETALQPGGILPDAFIKALSTDMEVDKPLDEVADEPDGHGNQKFSKELLFRCTTCKRVAHYSHLPVPSSFDEDASIAQIADYYQTVESWKCGDCASYAYPVDKIIAWRPDPPGAVEPGRPENQPPHYKDRLPREYLIKWERRSYRRLQWVPHMWLVAKAGAKLKNFLNGRIAVELLKEPVEGNNASASSSEPNFEIGAESRGSSVKPMDQTLTLPNEALVDAEKRIPLPWKTVDRVLDAVIWYPLNESRDTKSKRKGTNPVDEESLEEQRALVLKSGEPPEALFAGTVPEWESRTNRQISMEDIDDVAFAFFKWQDLPYDESTWDTPPQVEQPDYESFHSAFRRFVDSRSVVVPKLSKSHAEKFDNRDEQGYAKSHMLKDANDLDLGQDAKLKLMPFQVDGFNWLSNNWYTHQHCILADEMGLGKTVQIATFLGSIMKKWNAFPALVVVPNSTITNWVREFERWAPNLRVVPFYGEKKARKIIQDYELYHAKHLPSNTSAKFHVLVTTYETLIGAKDFTPIFKNQPRWEVLVVDEGQRLKSDSSLLFKKLNELNSIHRIIMTGTPLNNNIRELFNLMNFLDPTEWHDLEALEKEHEELTEELIKELHSRLRPYFLRRIKSEVLQLPPKNEVIVPVSMAPLQKEVYRSILSHNSELLKGLLQPSKLNGSAAKGKLNNVLMHLRKCLQHPYLYAEDIEPKDLSLQQAHEKLIDASAKLRFLKVLLPKLKERGHRVLLFSQFVIALNIIEDFLHGEGHKYLRLDGSTKNADRQKGMDEFNRPGSDVFIYLLTTRAGGVGINLFSADTVVIFDPDFNPHQDLQAIARAYRFGQQKTCLVFKLMVKESAEERIMQIGKKKLILDHLIVQKMDDDEDTGGENVQSILTYGAQALFNEDEGARDIVYTDQDIDNLIEKTEKEGDQEEAPKEGLSFAFAKIWAADKNTLEEIEDQDQVDSWAQTLEKITIEREKEQVQEVALSGRGARRRAADVAKTRLQMDDTPGKIKAKAKDKGKGKAPNPASDGSAYFGSDHASDSDSSASAPDEQMDDDFKDLDAAPRKQKQKQNPYPPPDGPLSTIQNIDIIDCGLCGRRHGGGLGECPMTDKSENLAEYREMLILHADDEPWTERHAAIRAIDEILHQRGKEALALIAGQPLHPIAKVSTTSSAPLKKKAKVSSHEAQNLPMPKPRVPEASTSKVYTAPVPLAVPNTVPHMQNPSTHVYTAPNSRTPVAFSNSTLYSNQPMSTAGPAGPSKRPASPVMAGELSKKKPKPSNLPCPVCEQSRPHLLKDCPVVLLGSKSVAQQITRLYGQPGMSDTVDILRKILTKQAKRELVAASAQGTD